MTTQQKTYLGQLAAVVRHHPHDEQAATDLRIKIKQAKAEEYIRQLVDEAPPLSASQRDQLALLLHGGGR